MTCQCDRIRMLRDGKCVDCGELPQDAPPFGEAGMCVECKAPMIWCVSSKGKRFPVDREPSPDGRLRIVPLGDKALADPFHGHRLDEARREGVALHQAHIETCPAASKILKRVDKRRRREGRREQPLR